jgi:hypothetical protein
MTPKEQDEFERMEVTAKLERARALIAQYDEHREHFRREIEKGLYRMGRLDERLEGTRQ